MAYKKNPDGINLNFVKLSKHQINDAKERNVIFKDIRKLKKLQIENYTNARHLKILELQEKLKY
jgi:hypothetical protein